MRPAARAIAAILTITALGGCQASLHSQMSPKDMTLAVLKNFEQGMTSSQVQTKLRSMGADQFTSSRTPNDPTPYVSGDLGVILSPKKFLGTEGLLDKFNRDILLFRFGSDNALDDAVWRPYNLKPAHGGPYPIPLDPENPDA